MVAGTPTQVGGDSAAAGALTDVLSIETEEASIVVRANGVQQIAVTDNTRRRSTGLASPAQGLS